MFFSKSARLLASITFFVGVLSFLIGISAVTGVLQGTPEEMARVVGRSPWRMIDLAGYIILATVALGTLAEISLTLRNIKDEE